MVGAQEYSTSPWLVDGHVEILATGNNVGIITEVTGVLANTFPLNSTQTIDSVINYDNLSNIIDDRRRCLGRSEPWCGNPTGEWIQVALKNRIV
jgi:hypothetical protein